MKLYIIDFQTSDYSLCTSIEVWKKNRKDALKDGRYLHRTNPKKITITIKSDDNNN